jgi:hypothetical protein
VRVRHHQSKAGKPMGFAAIEDLQGTIELVIFPSVWSRVSELIQYDQIVLVDGRLDASGGEPKVLVDNVTTDFNVTLPVQNDSTNQRISESAKRQTDKASNQQFGKSAISNQQSSNEDDYPPSAYDDLPIADDGIPPMPETPPDWEFFVPATPVSASTASPASPASVVSEPGGASEASQVSLANLAIGVFTSEDSHDEELAPTTVSESPQPDYPQAEPVEILAGQIPGERLPVETDKPGLAVEAVGEPALELPPEKAPERPIMLPPYLVPPPSTSQGEQVQMVTCVLRSMGDKTRDVLRLRRIHGTVMSYPGNDRFAIHVFERGRGYLVEFPNFTTGVCPELIAKLQFLVGADNVRVEPITFQ